MEKSKGDKSKGKNSKKTKSKGKKNEKSEHSDDLEELPLVLEFPKMQGFLQYTLKATGFWGRGGGPTKLFFKLYAPKAELHYYNKEKDDKPAGSVSIWGLSKIEKGEEDDELFPFDLNITIEEETTSVSLHAYSSKTRSSWIKALKLYKGHMKQCKKVAKNWEDSPFKMTANELLQVHVFREDLIKEPKGEFFVLDDSWKKWMTDRCLHRFLISRNWDHEKAMDMIKESIRWRQEEHPENISQDDVKKEMKSGVLYITGKDHDNQPVVLVQLNENEIDWKRYTILVKYIMEEALRMMDGDGKTEKWVWVVDLKHFSRKALPPREQVGEATHIMYTHYPERLHKLYILDAPFFFTLFWKVIQPFLEPETKDKVNFISGTDKLLKKVIPKAALPERYGGTWVPEE